MKPIDIDNDKELQRVLWACYEYWRNEPLPVEDRELCYSWVVGPYKKRFGTQFHQSKLGMLARLGWLNQADTSRGGGRRYYTIPTPERVKELLKNSKLA